MAAPVPLPILVRCSPIASSGLVGFCYLAVVVLLSVAAIVVRERVVLLRCQGCPYVVPFGVGLAGLVPGVVRGLM